MTAKKGTTSPKPAKTPPLTDDDGEVRELTSRDFQQFSPTGEAFPDVVEAFERMRGERGRQKAPTKERVGLRLDHEVVDHFRKTGPGWQSRINEVLARHVRGNKD